MVSFVEYSWQSILVCSFCLLLDYTLPANLCKENSYEYERTHSCSASEQFDHWEKLLTTLSEKQLTAPSFDLDWSIKDVIAHLWAWQQISVARMEAGARERKPDYPTWIISLENWEENADRVNALTVERNHEKLWSEVSQNWRNGFLRFLELGNGISERDLLDGDRYAWLKGYSLAFILVASYDHHQEHFEKLLDWLEDQED